MGARLHELAARRKKGFIITQPNAHGSCSISPSVDSRIQNLPSIRNSLSHCLFEVCNCLSRSFVRNFCVVTFVIKQASKSQYSLPEVNSIIFAFVRVQRWAKKWTCFDKQEPGRARPGRQFSQPRDHFFAHVCIFEACSLFPRVVACAITSNPSGRSRIWLD